MNWIILAIIAYFLIALEIILDKFLLTSRRVSHPAIYAFYSGILSLFTLVFFPFGMHSISFYQMLMSFLAGFIFTYGILTLFYAIQKGEASRVTTAAGAVIPVVTYFLSLFILEEKLSASQISGVTLLIFGGILISLKIVKFRTRGFFSGFLEAILAGVLLAVAFTLFKYFYEQDNFINVFIWTRLGLIAGALSLLIHPYFRKIIFQSLAKFKKPKKENKRSGLLFVLNKILGGSGSIILNYSIALGSVTIVNALICTEYVFVFLMGIVFSFWMPKIFQEKMDIGSAVQKLTAIFLITAGIVLVSRY